MKIEMLRGIALIATLGVIERQTATAQNLLVNPGFETGNFAGWTLSGSTAFEGVSSSFATTPYTGSYSAFFGAVNTYNIISQTFATTAGDQYNISFALDNSGGPYSEVDVDWGGKQVWDIQPTGTFGWTVFGFDELATGSSTTVSFAFRQDPSYFNLDDTSVVDLTGNTAFTAVDNISTLAPPIPDPNKPAYVPDHGAGFWTAAATLLGLCAVAGSQSRQPIAIRVR